MPRTHAQSPSLPFSPLRQEEVRLELEATRRVVRGLEATEQQLTGHGQNKS
jgi:hypothetical protein